jgi:sugar phosphate isomerase/epimerase
MCSGTLLPDPMQCDRAAFEQLVPAVASAGFRSLVLWPFHVEAVGPDLVQSMLADAGLSVPAVEALTQWALGAGPHVAEEAEPMLDFASRFDVDTVAACVLGPLDSVDRATDGFAEACDLAAAHGRRVCIEFLPWSGIPDLATAWRIVDAAGRSNGGIVLDTWHWVRQPGGPDLELLRTIPGDRIHYLQLCDAAPAPAPDLFNEAMTARRLPGDGIVDFAPLFDTLDAIGATPYVAAEVFNAELAAGGPGPMATAVRRACAAL